MKYVEQIAYILLLGAVLMASYNHEWLEIARYIASIGAAGVAIARLRERYEGKNLRLKRLMRLRHMVGIAYVVGAGLMFKEYNYWLVAFLIGVILELYTLFVLSKTNKDDGPNHDQNHNPNHNSNHNSNR